MVSGHSYFTCRITVLMMTQLFISYSNELYEKSALEYANPSAHNVPLLLLYAGVADCGIINYPVDYRLATHGLIICAWQTHRSSVPGNLEENFHNDQSGSNNSNLV